MIADIDPIAVALCAACRRPTCDHTDLEFAGLVPAPQSAAPIPGGSGGAGTFLPRRNASAPFLAHPIHDRRDQLADVNSLFHGGQFTCS